MALSAEARAELYRLRCSIAEIEGRLADAERLTLVPGAASGAEARGAERARLPFGIAALDATLGGGLPVDGLVEIRAGETRDGGAAGGFALALAARLAGSGRAPALLWISEADARRETGRLYAPGLMALGLDPGSVVEVAVHTRREALWAFEAALSCPAVGVAVCELRQASLDLAATRRCALRAHARGVPGFLLRLGEARPEPSAAELRFAVSPAPAGTVGGFADGIGRMAWRLGLEKNRLGPTGVFTVEWDSHARCFVERAAGWRKRRPDAHPQPLSAPSFDRSPDQAAAQQRRAS